MVREVTWRDLKGYVNKVWSETMEDFYLVEFEGNAWVGDDGTLLENGLESLLEHLIDDDVIALQISENESENRNA